PAGVAGEGFRAGAGEALPGRGQFPGELLEGMCSSGGDTRRGAAGPLWGAPRPSAGAALLDQFGPAGPRPGRGGSRRLVVCAGTPRAGAGQLATRRVAGGRGVALTDRNPIMDGSGVRAAT